MYVPEICSGFITLTAGAEDNISHIRERLRKGITENDSK